jgi:hypothetical protein
MPHSGLCFLANGVGSVPEVRWKSISGWQVNARRVQRYTPRDVGNPALIVRSEPPPTSAGPQAMRCASQEGH